MTETIAGASDLANLGIDKKIRVCCKGNANISVRAVPTISNPTDPVTPVETVTPIIVNANFSISRLS